jgi:hypothetical protein
MLRTLALVAAGAGGLGSVALLLQMGRRNDSLALLVFFFSIWVLSPFLGLIFAIVRSRRWTETIRTALYILTIGVAVASILIYTRIIDLKPASSANTFLFVAVPPATWVCVVAVLAIATLAARSQSRQGGTGKEE